MSRGSVERKGRNPTNNYLSTGLDGGELYLIEDYAEGVKVCSVVDGTVYPTCAFWWDVGEGPSCSLGIHDIRIFPL
jgi:hypothetical protein